MKLATNRQQFDLDVRRETARRFVDAIPTLGSDGGETVRQALLNALQACGIDRLAVQYQGFDGDFTLTISDCGVDSVAAALQRPAPPSLLRLRRSGAAACDPYTLESAVLDFAFAVSAAGYPSWHEDEGSRGTLLVDAARGGFVLQHEQRVWSTYFDFEF